MKQVKEANTDTTIYELIKGTYNPEDAAEIIYHMIRKKIDFHEVRNFSQEVRFGTKDENSVNRIGELKIFSQDFTDLIQYAKEQGKELKVKANIQIDLV